MIREMNLSTMTTSMKPPARTLSYQAALDILQLYGGDAPWVRHCMAVARVAEHAGEHLLRYCEIDREHLRIGGLLHDIGRYKTHDPVMHGVEGFHLLSGLGHHREAHICASHVLCGLSREDALRCGLPDRAFLPRSLEEKLVPVIDGVVEFDRPTTLDDRIASLVRRYRSNPAFLERLQVAHARARTLLDELDRMYGLSLERIAVKALR
jgi:uncharacterized protein